MTTAPGISPATSNPPDVVGVGNRSLSISSMEGPHVVCGVDPSRDFGACRRSRSLPAPRHERRLGRGPRPRRFVP